MKNIMIIMLLLGFALPGLAHDLGAKEEHGNPEDEKVCFREIRRMNCGSPQHHKAFIACVDFRIEELSERCQLFHADEMERMKNHGY